MLQRKKDRSSSGCSAKEGYKWLVLLLLSAASCRAMFLGGWVGTSSIGTTFSEYLRGAQQTWQSMRLLTNETTSTDNGTDTTGEMKIYSTQRTFPHSQLNVTILVDSGGSCPKKCGFLHHLLPSWVRYRYESFRTSKDLYKVQFPNGTHAIIIGRSDLGALGTWAAHFRATTGGTVGLLHMADETNTGSIYAGFDYVFRHYYFGELKGLSGVKIRALGNLTCGTGPEWPTPEHIRQANEPPLGVHWSFLPVGPVTPGVEELSRRSADSVWPSRYREQNCVFIGLVHQKRKDMFNALQGDGADLNCSISSTGGFGSGLQPWDYINNALAKSKIGMNPAGNNAETHRLAELLATGTIPAMIDADFMHAPFRDVPGIIGKDWNEVIRKMRAALEKDNIDDLELLQQRVARFYEDMQNCLKSDIDVILSRISSRQA